MRLYALQFGVCVLAALLLPCRAGAGKPMSVEDAVRISLQNNFNIEIARISAEAARNDTGRGTAGFLPRLDAQSTYRYDDTHRRGGTAPPGGDYDYRTYASQLSLQWTLFDGFRMFADNRRYQELARFGEEQARDSIETTVVAVMRAYFELVRQEQLLDVARTNREISRARLEREEVRRSLGGASSTDLLNARVNFNADQAYLLEQELRVTIARKELNILMAHEPDESVQVKKEIDIPPLELSLQELQQYSRQISATLQAAHYRLQAAEEQVRMADAAYWPRLSLGGQYGYTNRNPVGSSSSQAAAGGFYSQGTSRTRDASVSLQLSFNLFNGNLDRIAAQNARLDARSAALSHADIQNRLSGVMYELYSTFVQQGEVVELEKQNTVTAEQNLVLQQERYLTGASDSLDFRDAQVNVLRAQAALITARYRARISLIGIQQLIGQIAVD